MVRLTRRLLFETDIQRDYEDDFGEEFLSSSCTSGKKGPGSDLRLFLGVLGVPLAPVHIDAREPLPNLCAKDAGTSSVQYILQQYVAASGHRSSKILFPMFT
ncbi:hypothetical protein MLD38_034480 [Melastoma candidum]|uniref:Uncharacterized protein n=1 Tax=Melastoma candidum TaxID=119954 RepID=A0ACB9M9P8_9MYRT|nr:hypothetical protein MLD38_034480 [Melastoma candidum]